jgi:hypothetical protein
MVWDRCWWRFNGDIRVFAVGVTARVGRRKICGRSDDRVDAVLNPVGEAVPVVLQRQRKGEPFQARIFGHLHLSVLKVAVSDGRDDHNDLNFAAVGVHAPAAILSVLAHGKRCEGASRLTFQRHEHGSPCTKKPNRWSGSLQRQRDTQWCPPCSA